MAMRDKMSGQILYVPPHRPNNTPSAPGCQHLPKRLKTRSLESKQLVTFEVSNLAATLMRCEAPVSLTPPSLNLRVDDRERS